MKELNYLKYQIIVFVNHSERKYNVNQLKQTIMNQLLNSEEYDKYFNKAFNFLKDNDFLNVGINNSGIDTVSTLTEKGETVLKFDSWDEYLQSIEVEKIKEKEYRNIDFELKKTTLKNQKFTSYTSIGGLVFGMGSMIWSIMDKYELIFVNIWIYFIILVTITAIVIYLYKRL